MGRDQSKANKAYYARNKEFFAAYSSDYYRENKARLQMKKIERLYGVTPEQYDQLFKAAGEACEICRRPVAHATAEAGRADKACLDHCHDSGKARGILCISCNSKFSLFDNHRAAVTAYMEKHQ